MKFEDDVKWFACVSRNYRCGYPLDFYPSEREGYIRQMGRQGFIVIGEYQDPDAAAAAIYATLRARQPKTAQ